MYSRFYLSSNITLATALLMIAAPQNSLAFTSSFTPMAPSISHAGVSVGMPVSAKSRRTRSQRWMALDMPMRPMEDEKEKNSKDDKVNTNQDREWKQVVGGFVPKFLKRSSTQEGSEKGTYKITTVDTLEDYKRVVVDETDKIVVVRFFAQWCKSCKAAAPLFRKLVSQYSDQVLFVDAPLTKETAYLHEGLGVPSVPFAHIYHPEAGLVEERKINKKVFSDFREAFESYVRGSCDIPEEEEDEEECDDGFQ